MNHASDYGYSIEGQLPGPSRGDRSVNVPWNYEEMAASMEPHQFELLVRAYVRQQLLRVQDLVTKSGRLPSNDVSASLALKINERGIMTDAKWSVCWGWGDDTKGEILEPACTELARRRGWQESPLATLRQIGQEVSDGSA